MKKHHILRLVIIPFMLMMSLGCSSMAGRYIGYRLSPDRVSTKGTIDIPVGSSVTAPVTVYLDDFAVPHIRAGNEHDLYFALGYMQGRDRRFQLEMYKMLGYGRLRELVGDRDKTGILKQTEIVSRMLGFYKDAEYLLEEAPEEDLRLLEAFAAGINEATRREPPPMEFRILDYEPEPWEPKDSMVIFAMISFGLSKNWEHELSRLELMVHQLRIGQDIDRGMKIFKPVYELPPYLISEPADLPDELRDEVRRNGSGNGGIPAVPPELASYLQEFVRNNPEADMSEPAEDAGLVYRGMDNWYRGNSASNNWAVSGEWSGTGKAAMATDSHMPHMLPAMGYLFHIEKTGDYSVIGAGFTGLPAVAFGTNGKAAWGATSNWADTTDLYVERQPEGAPDSYLDEGEAVRFGTRTEIFKIRRDDGTMDEERFTVRETKNGVLLNDFTGRIEENFPLVALKRNRFLGRPLSTFRDVYRSESAGEAGEHFLSFGAFTGHWVLADAGGEIVYTGSARLPIRTSHLGSLPVPGWLEKYQWKGYVAPENMPRTENPQEGYLGTANNQVVDPYLMPYPLNYDGSTPFRFQRIREVLEEGQGDKSVSRIMTDLQMDDTFTGWEWLKPRFAEALTPLLSDEDPLTVEAARRLLEWDGRNLDDSVAPLIFNIYQTELFTRAMEDEVSPKTMHFYLSFYNLEPFVYDLLHNPDNPAWDDIRTGNRESYADVLRTVFRETVEICKEEYGGEVSKWTWRRGADFFLEHPFGTEKALAGFLNRGPLPLRGATDTLFAHQIQRSESPRFDIKGGPVLRVVVDFGNWEESYMSLPGGESGRPVSPHYDDILPLYLEGKGIPLQTDFSVLEAESRGRLLLH